MLKVNIITLFPDIFKPHLSHLPLKRAIEKDLIDVNFINLKDFSLDERGTVDSPPYGGGPGMILRPEPIYNAITSILDYQSANIIFLTPKGQTYNQQEARQLSTKNHLIIVCGRYEGIDQRVIDYFHGQEISIGNYVLSGGEVAAMVVLESIARLIPNAIENKEALENESFNKNKVEHPQYSRPEKWMDFEVPKTLLSGHHKKIEEWKDKNSPIF